MIEAISSLYSVNYPKTVIYMLQTSEYRLKPYLKWYWRTTNFNTVMHRRQLDYTGPAKRLLGILWLGMMAQLITGLLFLGLWTGGGTPALLQYSLGLVISYPIVWAHLILLPMLAARFLIVEPQERRLVRSARDTFANHRAKVIAVAGSYGKTTMKEILATVLSEGKKVAVTSGNMNVPVSHARWARTLKGDEDILVIEYGEGRPGDIRAFAETTQPDIGIITGLAPAHLDAYPNLASAGQDIFSLAQYLNNQNVYINGESEAAKPFIKPDHQLYGRNGALGWKVRDIKTDFDGVNFTMTKAKKRLDLKSELLGRHQVGPLVLAAALADQLGLTDSQIKEGIAKTVPFEHRMQPRVVGGAWVIDDTYNGNIDGVKAGLELLKQLPAKRKIYVTPGLVDQGVEMEKVHVRIGELIAQAKPDTTVLMKNSVTNYIKRGLKANAYKGEIKIENNPLQFYANLDQFVAAGDLVMMQNDWPDQYS